MDIGNIALMFGPIIITVIGGWLTSIIAGGLAPDMHGFKKQLLVIGLCLVSGIVTLWLNGEFAGTVLDFSTTDATFTSVGTLLKFAFLSWGAAQVVYYKYTKKAVADKKVLEEG